MSASFVSRAGSSVGIFSRSFCACVKSQSIFRIERASLQRRLEQMGESIGIGRQQLELILHESRGDAMLAVNPLAQAESAPRC